MSASPTPDLISIQRLQFTDLAGAQEQARRWLAEQFGIAADGVELRPSAVSLNSFNGIYTAGGERVFFKSHIEPGSTIREYYNAQILHDAGYNTILPLRVESEEGRQIAFYRVIDEPTIFDMVRTLETGGDPGIAERILDAERRSCAEILAIYRRTAETTSAADHATAPIHQLIHHRLTAGRFDTFYGGDATLEIPGGAALPMAQVLDMRWTINGVAQPRTLRELVGEAARVLDPNQDALTVIGHGDAHFGNVFLDSGDFLYFDPAFAGRHAAALDLIKPLFHNVFANWMYFPAEAAARVPVTATLRDGALEVDYGPHLTPYRQQLLAIKHDQLLAPVSAWLGEAGALPHGRRSIHLALMCCPLLTMNLCDHGRFPAAAALLGMALAVQMGNGDVEQELRTSPDQAVR